MENNKFYIGDGVYVEYCNGDVWLYTFDGIEYTNAIFLESCVLDQLNSFYETQQELRSQNSMQ